MTAVHWLQSNYHETTTVICCILSSFPFCVCQKQRQILCHNIRSGSSIEAQIPTLYRWHGPIHICGTPGPAFSFTLRHLLHIQQKENVVLHNRSRWNLLLFRESQYNIASSVVSLNGPCQIIGPIQDTWCGPFEATRTTSTCVAIPQRASVLA